MQQLQQVCTDKTRRLPAHKGTTAGVLPTRAASSEPPRALSATYNMNVEHKAAGNPLVSGWERDSSITDRGVGVRQVHQAEREGGK